MPTSVNLKAYQDLALALQLDEEEVTRIHNVPGEHGYTGDRVLFRLFDPSDPDDEGFYIWVFVVTDGPPEEVATGERSGDVSAAILNEGRITELDVVFAKDGKQPKPGDIDKSAVASVSGLSLDFDDFVAAMSQSSTSDRYSYQVSLFDGDVKISSDKGSDNIEVGTGGKATVTGGGGNDTVWIWQQKDVDFDGGKGSDTLSFDYQDGFAPQPATGADVDLSTGTATNPHGGTIKFANVENVIGQFGASNNIKGDGNANHLQGGTLADTLLGLGGDDSIYVKYNATGGARATKADGGAGTDTLTAELTYMEPFIGSGLDQKSINRLDLTDQNNNTGTFKGGIFENFEVFKVAQDFNTLFHFIGSAAGEKVYGTGFEDDFDGGGGNDLLAGGFAADELTGGEGADRFWFRYAADSNAAGRDTIIDFSHADHDRIDLSKIFDGKLDFLGSKNFTGHAGEVRVRSDGSGTLVEADTSGDKVADFVVLLEGGPTVVAADLVL